MADDNPRVFIGANNPPAADPFDGFLVHIDDLYTEAKNWLDGEGIQDQGQADAVSKLLDMVRQANKDADAARAAEKKPHDEAAKAVQSKWKPLLERCELTAKVCKDALAPWLRRLDEEKRAAAEAALKEAEDKAREAAAALLAAKGNDLAAREEAEALAADAKRAEAVATRAANDKAHATGGARAVGLRTYYTPELTDASLALRHYVSTNPDAIKACLLSLAKADVQAGKRQIPGFTVHEEKRVA